MKSRHVLAAAFVTAAVLLTGLSTAEAETFSGKVLAMTKQNKATMIEIAPEGAGGQPSYRYTVSTEFQEIADMLMKAMETRTGVTVTSSESCKQEGALRHCGSIVTAETAAK
ncbi:hypothetical protein [Candidatus Electronema sp. JM]|uniref:hypothetical protein n=1 Tax=Candidatus Electronema sp. JM TaxID=3401571 RepID=UPI003AA905DC